MTLLDSIQQLPRPWVTKWRMVLQVIWRQLKLWRGILLYITVNLCNYKTLFMHLVNLIEIPHMLLKFIWRTWQLTLFSVYGWLHHFVLIFSAPQEKGSNIIVALASCMWLKRNHNCIQNFSCLVEKIVSKSIQNDITLLDWLSFFRIVGGGVPMGPLVTSATEWPIVPAPGDYDDGEFGGMKIGSGNRSTRRKRAPAPLCPPQIPLDQTRARTRAAAVGSQRLTTWAMVRPRLAVLVLYECIQYTVWSNV
jgi:hypothetical protein